MKGYQIDIEYLIKLNIVEKWKDLDPHKLYFLYDEGSIKHYAGVASYDKVKHNPALNDGIYHEIANFYSSINEEKNTLKNASTELKSNLLSRATSNEDNMFNLLRWANKNTITDIHFDPNRSSYTVRVRSKGLLRNIKVLDKDWALELISVAKVRGGLDITKFRVPQDGKLTYEQNNIRFNCRLATMPTEWGEKLVIRLLDSQSTLQSIKDLNMPKNIEDELYNIKNLTTGAVIFAGPTGSGKTTTVYALLREINREDINIMTIENPIEYQVKGINQTEVNEKAGINFHTYLRSMLRMDPDVLLVGETRDKITAELMVSAGITGHLIFSTLHSSNAMTAISRLLDMGVEGYKLNASLRYIIAQRLVRILCPLCKRRTSNKAATYNFDLFEAVGCNNCDDGYVERRGIYEVLKIDDLTRKHIKSLAFESDNLKKQVEARIINPLGKQVEDLFLEGEITHDEYQKLLLSIS